MNSNVNLLQYLQQLECSFGGILETAIQLQRDEHMPRHPPSIWRHVDRLRSHVAGMKYSLKLIEGLPDGDLGRHVQPFAGVLEEVEGLLPSCQEDVPADNPNWIKETLPGKLELVKERVRGLAVAISAQW